MSPTTAREWLDLVLDPGWSLLFEDVVFGDPLKFPGYAEQLAAARAKTGCTEAVLVAEGTIEKQQMIAISFEFGFLGGSMGVAAGERICRAFERAAKKKMSVIALAASGGARMQEGMLALSQMPATLIARRKLADAGQGFTCYLRNPTTGGVYASFASSADLLWAEPNATIGFAGPRVVETLTGERLPEGSHTAESALLDGSIDEIVPPEDIRSRVGPIAVTGPAQGSVRPPAPQADGTEPWTRIERARARNRPTGSDYVDVIRQIRRGGVDDSIVTGLAWASRRLIVAIAQNRYAGDGRTRAGGFRRARRAIGYATRFGLPIVTFIDTPGADPSAESESDGIAQEISATFQALLEAAVPTLGVVVGEGGSGGALALAACDQILMLENAIFSVIAPEGAASILRQKDVSKVAGDLKLTAHDLLALGIADHVLPEPSGGADQDPDTTRNTVELAIDAAQIEMDGSHVPTARRLDRWRVFK